ncbi:hypothetical protein DICPUDRAFT_156015 [Dictyostelium purpureum]|uniref:Iron-binding zinc finger CDGSH type domain-containing protein n=1 Tax=Dictyostelium purpureum TaxID=5786 RepID=F0ZVG9_DICPU|nr:uncharacterized protein DICPUDRAFT_156015 [Dictyostelium purpureum]EGC32063.1 hypothetical protein DICPUDRAFT_156015 [Dictyostelium purpureum]|eukprot:XP_003291417.1 hypothetical protein DICPUDRAFT_156015 [Dictyostelium purpureum]
MDDNNKNNINNSNNDLSDSQNNVQIKECSNECKKSSQCEKCGLCKLVPEKIPLYGPYTVRGLEPNTQYYYCTCGKTTIQQPLCDQKTCIGTDFTPKPFTLTKKQTLYLLCGCRYTGNPPHCDAIHTRVPFNPQDPPCKCDKNDSGKTESICKKATDW